MQLEGFDPNTFLYFEENILWEKIKRLGKFNYVDTSLRCIHLGASTTSKYFSIKLLRKSFESEIYFAKQYLAHGPYKAALLKLSHMWVILAFTLRKWLTGR